MATAGTPLLEPVMKSNGVRMQLSKQACKCTKEKEICSYAVYKYLTVSSRSRKNLTSMDLILFLMSVSQKKNLLRLASTEVLA
jgi:hypothetical protein